MSKREPVGEWEGNEFKATDGRRFCIFSEHPRGEDRWYFAQECVPADSPAGFVWQDLPGDGGFTKGTQRTRVERYVRATLAGANP